MFFINKSRVIDPPSTLFSLFLQKFIHFHILSLPLHYLLTCQHLIQNVTSTVYITLLVIVVLT